MRQKYSFFSRVISPVFRRLTVVHIMYIHASLGALLWAYAFSWLFCPGCPPSVSYLNNSFRVFRVCIGLRTQLMSAEPDLYYHLVWGWQYPLNLSFSVDRGWERPRSVYYVFWHHNLCNARFRFRNEAPRKAGAIVYRRVLLLQCNGVISFSSAV